MNNLAISVPVDRMPQPYWQSDNTASSDLAQNLTSQLRAYFRAEGCVPLIAEELGRRSRASLPHECERFSGGKARVHGSPV